jgi:hypothetical protein
MTIKLASPNLFQYFYAIVDYSALLFIHYLFLSIDAPLSVSSYSSTLLQPSLWPHKAPVTKRILELSQTVCATKNAGNRSRWGRVQPMGGADN